MLFSIVILWSNAKNVGLKTQQTAVYGVYYDFSVQILSLLSKDDPTAIYTRHPTLEASWDQKQIVSRWRSTTQTRFTNSLDRW